MRKRRRREGKERERVGMRREDDCVCCWTLIEMGTKGGALRTEAEKQTEQEKEVKMERINYGTGQARRQPGQGGAGRGGRGGEERRGGPCFVLGSYAPLRSSPPHDVLAP